MYLIAVALAAASPAPPVEVVSREVTLMRHDVAPIEVRCNRVRRSCRGVLVLGIRPCGGPAVDQDCQVGVGRRRFAIRAGATRTVFVRRGNAQEHTSARPDVFTVGATPFLGRRATSWRTRWTRSVRLVAPSRLSRPRLPLALRKAERVEVGRDAVRFHAAVPLGTTSASGALADRPLELHRRMFAAYVVGRESFAAAGELWHGELPVGRDEFRRGERHPYRLGACDPGACAEIAGEAVMETDERLVPTPICALRPL